MAKATSKASGNRISNIMDLGRGLIDFRKASKEEVTTKSYGSSELLTPTMRTNLLRATLRPEQNVRRNQSSPVSQVMTMMSSSYSKVGQERLENRRILELMPEVRKATRLMIASIFSPSDLTRHEIGIHFDKDGVDEEVQTKLGEFATSFFQRKLNLKTNGPNWVYQFGYETGSAVFAIIPMEIIERLNEETIVGTEAFISTVVEPTCRQSLLGFGDDISYLVENKHDLIGLESIGLAELKDFGTSRDYAVPIDRMTAANKEIIEKFIGHEALNLTDNPSVLRLNSASDEKRKRRTNDKLKERFKNAIHQPFLELEADKDQEPIGNPMLLRLPPESVTVIHTPGAPDDHQGYLVLLDITGNPVNIVTQDADEAEAAANFNNRSKDIFSQVNQAYGLGTASRSSMDRQTMEHMYRRIVGRHIEKRLGKAGYNQIEIPNMDATMRCLFNRMLREKRTRILFLPKELVTYMTFEVDQYGYGVSKLNGIKFALGMKMALQVSRVLAAIKAAMDKRLLTMKFSDSMMEQPESMIQNLIDQYIQKNGISFSTDPSSIQSQIQAKSFTIKTEGIPGMEDFSVTNEADNKSGTSDFDSGMTEYLDKQIINGLDVPASTMNSLNEDEYARSVTTTNLFFAMEVSIYQDVVIRLFSDLLRKYARFSAEFQKELYDILPELGKKKVKNNNTSSTDETSDTANDEQESRIPSDCTLDDIIDAMLISLPKPNIAPSKAHFESLEGMTTAITNMMASLFPDELAGADDKMRSVIALLRARLTATNIRSYLESVGMSGIEIPEGNSFSEHLGDIDTLQNGLQNLYAMLEAKVKIRDEADALAAAAGGGDPNAAPPGYA